MLKPSTKHGKGTTALFTSKSSWKSVDALKDETNPKPQGMAIKQKSPIMHSRSHSTDANVPQSIKSRSCSVITWVLLQQ